MNALTFVLVAAALLVGAFPAWSHWRAPWLGWVGIGGITAVAMHVGKASIALAGACVALTVLWAVRDLVHRRRMLREEVVLADYLTTVAARLRAGASVPVALSAAAERAEVAAGQPRGAASVPAVVQQLRAASRIAASGGDVGTAFAEVTSIGPLVSLAASHGIPLAGLCEQAHAHLEQSQRHRRATAASLQGPRTTALVLTLLPGVGILMGTVMGADPLGLLFGGGLGGILLVVGVGLCCAGFAWAQVVLNRAGAMS